jgi:type II secretory pathway pseudopilin PulG
MKLKTHNSSLKTLKGQSIIEVIVAIGVGAILIGAAAFAIVPILRSNLESRSVQVTTSLNQEYTDDVKNLSESNWQNIYGLPKGSDSKFFLNASGTDSFKTEAGTTSTLKEGRNFTSYFFVENVNRDSCGIGNITASTTTGCSKPGDVGVAGDPSTQKITVVTEWPNGATTASSSRVQYITRSRNKVFIQTDWSGGGNQEGPITKENNKFATSTDINFTGSPGSIKIKGL